MSTTYGRYLRRVDGGFAHYCPACQAMHVYFVDKPSHSGARWKFNENPDLPTFTPSMNIRWGTYADPTYVDEGRESGICHYFVMNGQIMYCGDCTHDMKGKTVPLPELPSPILDDVPLIWVGPR